MLVIEDLGQATIERAGALVAREHDAARQARRELPTGFGSAGVCAAALQRLCDSGHRGRWRPTTGALTRSSPHAPGAGRDEAPLRAADVCAPPRSASGRSGRRAPRPARARRRPPCRHPGRARRRPARRAGEASGTRSSTPRSPGHMPMTTDGSPSISRLLTHCPGHSGSTPASTRLDTASSVSSAKAHRVSPELIRICRQRTTDHCAATENLISFPVFGPLYPGCRTLGNDRGTYPAVRDLRSPGKVKLWAAPARMLSVAMRKSPCVARSRSPLVAS